MSDIDINAENCRSSAVIDVTPTSVADNAVNEKQSSENKQPVSEEGEQPSKDQSIQSSVQQSQKRVINKMYNICSEFCFIMALVITTYAAFQERPPKISRPPAPRPFFPEGSLVSDWFRGELGRAMLSIIQEDLSFVMYYAPWDAESQAVKKEFDLAASFLYKEVHFTAINCWQPGSECALQRLKFGTRFWPGLIAHVGEQGLIYNGPYTAPYMIRFLRNLAMPLRRITDYNEINELLGNYDAVVYGTVTTSAQYSVLYSTALHLLERDPLQEIIVAVSTVPLTYLPSPSLELFLWNMTLVYPEHGNWTSSALTTWILSNLDRPLNWLLPLNHLKSQYLSSHLQPGPALILFTPRNPLLPRDSYYQVLRELAICYSCGSRSFVSHFAHRFLSDLKLELQIAECTGQEKSTVSHQEQTKENFAFFSHWPKTHLSNSFNMCANHQKFSDYIGFDVGHCWSKLSDNRYTECNLTKKNIVDESTCTTDSKSRRVRKSKVSTSILNTENDPRSPINLLKWSEIENCRMIRAAYKVHEPIFYNQDNTFILNDSQISSCGTNVTLSIIAIDSLQFPEFANALGIDISSKPERTEAVIVDAAHESHFVMNKTFSLLNLRNFVLNFTSNSLTHQIGSKIEPLKGALSFKSVNNNNNYRRYCEGNNTVCLMELTSKTFLNTVIETKKAFVILYHSAQCAFCADASRTFLRLAQLFSSLKLLRFVRIDGETHTLPWNYNMPYYPTILFVPKNSKSDSRVFPQNIARTVPHLISFILANIEPDLRLHALWILCYQSKIREDRKSCVSKVRHEFISLIDSSTKEWRRTGMKSDLRSRVLLRRIQHLKSLQMLLATSKSKTSVRIAFEKLHSTWTIQSSELS